MSNANYAWRLIARNFVSVLAALALFATNLQAQQPNPTYIGASPPPHVTVDAELDAGFDLLYQLKFGQAGEKFSLWERQFPKEPLGPALAAAADLFEEFYKQGILTSDFFLDDERFLGGIKGKPDADLESGFIAAADRSERRAHRRLAEDPGNPDALFALTLTAGMRADNAAFIEKKQLDGLRYLRESNRRASELLSAAPNTEDAYLALGAANYIVGSLPTYKRAFLWLGGVHGDKALGLQQLARAASKGHYLRPYAQLLLALAALREKDTALARSNFARLIAEYPENPLFATELAKVTPRVGPPASSLAP